MKAGLRARFIKGVLILFSGVFAPGQAPPEPVAIADRALATLTVPGFVDFLAADGDTVWATNEGRVEAFRPDASMPVATVTLVKPCGAMVVAFGSLWVANCRTASVDRIDLHTRQLTASIATGLADLRGELSLAAGGEAVWVLSDRSGVLSRLDPQTNQVAARFQVAPNSFAAGFGFGAVWITNTYPVDGPGPGSVQRIDAATGSVVATIPVGPEPRFLAVGEGAVWTLNQGDGTVSRIDPATNSVAAVIDVGMKGSGGDIAAGGGRVWVRGKWTLLVAIDPARNQVIEVFGPPAGSGAVRVAGKRVWVTAHDVRTVWVLPTGD